LGVVRESVSGGEEVVKSSWLQYGD
jgi:hypothetical protein